MGIYTRQDGELVPLATTQGNQGPVGPVGPPGNAYAEPIDHEEIGATLTISTPGAHEVDLTVNTTITVTTPYDVSIFAHATPSKTLTINDDVFTIDGDEVLLVITSPRNVQYAYMAGAATTDGEEPPPVVNDPPTQPGTVTVDSTTDGYNLTWVASTVAAGYEVQIDGGAWVDSGSDLAHSYTGLVSGSSHSGAVRAYNSEGARSTSRAWGPASVDTVGLHEQLLSYDPEVYLRMSQGSLEVFDQDTTNPWVALGTITYDGDPLVPGATGSAKIAGNGLAKYMDDFADTTTMTIVAVAKWPTASGAGGTDIVQLSTEKPGDEFGFRAKADYSSGPTPTIDLVSVGSTHTCAWRKEAGNTAFDHLVEGVYQLTRGEWADWEDPTVRVLFKRFGPEVMISHLMITTTALTNAQILAIAQAAGTDGNAR